MDVDGQNGRNADAPVCIQTPSCPTKTISKSTVATIVAKRTKGKPGKVTVSFDPTGPAEARKATK